MPMESSTLFQHQLPLNKTKTIQDMTRVIIHANKVHLIFWAETMNTTCYVINRVLLRPRSISTSYEIWKGRKPSIKHFHIFGSTYYIMKDRVTQKLNAQSDKGIFLGYSSHIEVYRVYNERTKTIMELVNIFVHGWDKSADHFAMYLLNSEFGTSTAQSEKVEPKTSPEVPANDANEVRLSPHDFNCLIRSRRIILRHFYRDDHS